MNGYRQLPGSTSAVTITIFLLAAMQGSRAQEDQAATQDIGAAHTRVTWHVANNGVDSSECGKRFSPCRSISQAIVNSTAGDLILVGPGRYGDLNENDFPFDEGEEPGGLVNITKRLTVVSVAGAEFTILEAAVEIAADEAVVGNPGKGFTLTDNPTAFGLTIDGPLKNATVSGNIARGNRWGFRTQGGFNHKFVGNVALNNEIGFQIASIGARVTDNVALSQARTEPGGLEGTGFRIVNLDAFVARNVAISSDVGFDISGSGHVLHQNSAIGNRHYGIRLRDLADLGPIERGNIFGNNIIPLDGNVNCGMLNATNLTVSATNNFWGAATGPGTDPADAACDVGGGQIIHTPFARKEFRLRHKWNFGKSTPGDVEEATVQAQ